MAANQEFVIFSPFHKRLGGIEDENCSADGGKENDKNCLNTAMQNESNKPKFSRSFGPDGLNLKSASVLSPVKSKTGSKRKQRSLRKTTKKLEKPPTVTFKYNVKVAKIPERKDWGSFMTQIFGKEKSTNIRDLAVVEHTPS